MNAKDLYRAIGEAEEELLQRADRKPARSPWRPLLIAACLLLAVSLGTVGLFFRHGMGSAGMGSAGTPSGGEESGGEAFGPEAMEGAASDGSDVWWYETLLSENCLYISAGSYFAPDRVTAKDFPRGLWYFDPETGEASAIHGEAAALYRTQTGLYGVDRMTGDLFRLEGAEAVPAGTMPKIQEDGMMTDPWGTFIGLVDGVLYFRTGEGTRTAVFARDPDGTIREIYASDGSEFIASGFLRDGIYYFQRDMTAANVSYGALNMETGTVSTLTTDYRSYPNGAWPYQTGPNEFYADCVLSGDYWAAEAEVPGPWHHLDRKDYDTGVVTEIAAFDQYMTVLRRQGNTVYVTMSLGSENPPYVSPKGRVASVDLGTGAVTELLHEIPSAGGEACEKGVYYEADGKLWFLDYAGEETKIALP